MFTLGQVRQSAAKITQASGFARTGRSAEQTAPFRWPFDALYSPKTLSRLGLLHDAPSPVRPAEWAAILTIAFLFCATLVSLALNTGVTVDEPAHLLSGRLYWEGRDNLKPGDMPPLIKIVSGWVPNLLKAPMPDSAHPTWKTQHEWPISQAMMEAMTASQIRRCLFFSRLPMIVFPLATCLLLWWWGRQLFGSWAGVIAAALFCLSPTVLGHGALVKNDLAASCCYLFFWYRAWRFWRAPALSTTAFLALALLLAMLAKYSMFVLVLIAPLLVLARSVVGKRIAFGKLSLCLVVLVALTYVGLLAAWQFRMDPLTPDELRKWKGDANIPKWLVSGLSAASSLPVPGAVWRGGMSLVSNNGGQTPVYLNGEIHPGGHPLYFIEALGLKLPVPVQLCAGIALILLAYDAFRRRLSGADALWILPGFLYLFLASQSSLQLGVRLVLPAIVFLFLIAGRCFAHVISNAKLRLASYVLLAFLAVRTVQAYPNYISFFNLWVRDPWTGLRYLSDSNIDWGQDVPRLAQWHKTHKVGRLRVALFSNDPLWAYFDDRQIEAISPPWSPSMVGGRTRYEPRPGYYAISATLITGQFLARDYQDYFEPFRHMKPIDRAGNSIYIFKVQN